MRVLGAVRQSARRERGVSPAEQKRAIQRWADDRGHEVVKFTEDLARSGKLSAFKRPELGPWFTDPDKVVLWDILVTTKIDRACRNTLDFLTLYQWCDANGKQYVSLKEHIDMTTAQGRQNARDAASRAEWERDMDSERRLETIAELERQGRWTGGRIPYGFVPEVRDDFGDDHDEQGYVLVVDEDYPAKLAQHITPGTEVKGKIYHYRGTADVARRMGADAIEGKPYLYIRDWLNAEGYPPNVSKQWHITTVREVLRSPNMAALLSAEDYGKLYVQTHSGERVIIGTTRRRHWTLHVAFCGACKGSLYARIRTDVHYGGYYTCKNHGGCGVWCVQRIGLVDNEIESQLHEIWQNQEYRRRVVVPGDSHAAEIHRLNEQLKVAQSLDFVDTAPLEAKIAELKATHTPDTIEWGNTGTTVAQHWASLDGPAERNRFLRDRDVKFLVYPDRIEPWSIPEEWNPRHIVRAS